jgi:hypothetical protein
MKLKQIKFPDLCGRCFGNFTLKVQQEQMRSWKFIGIKTGSYT